MSDDNRRPVAVIVGGSTGIGRGIADAWALHGIETHVFSRSRPTGQGGDRLTWHQLDFRDSQQARAALADRVPHRVDLVCFSAVYYTARRESFVEVSEADWQDQFTINVHALAWTLKATLPALRAAAPGMFLNVTSEVVYNAGPHRAAYAATKAAADSLIRSVAQEIDPAEVSFVQALPAGMVNTPGIQARRRSDFDYAGYMAPSDFGPLALELAMTRGVPYAGDALVVHDDTTWSSVSKSVPESQSCAADGNGGGAVAAH